MLDRRRSGVAILALSLLALRSYGQSTPEAPPIVGTWLLESIVDTLEDGSRSYWMGPEPMGAIIYSASGHMSVQFVRDPRPRRPATARAHLATRGCAGGRSMTRPGKQSAPSAA